MDEFKGIVRIRYNDKVIGFKFGTMQTALFCKTMNCKLSELDKVLDGSDIEAQLNWFWTASVAYSRLFKTDEISIDELSAIIDSYGFSNLEQDAAASVVIPKEEAQ